MTFHKFYCMVALCDGCGEKCWETDPAPHFANEREARQTLQSAYEWRIEREITGRFRMLCGGCADREDCAKYGHDSYVPEADPNTEQQAKWEQHHPFPIKMCRRCSAVLRDDAPAAGHPDSIDHRLPADLAELDRLTWPQGSEVNGRVVSLNPIDDHTYRGDDQ